MAQQITVPQPLDLLPPLLACLSSPAPPPGILPLLSPVLRQRVRLLAADNAAPNAWLQLLSWDPSRAAKLPKLIGGIELEPHPSSGEIEIPETGPVKYRRLDAETLHARLDLTEWGFVVLYLWCMGDETGWRVAELRALADAEDGTNWVENMEKAQTVTGAATNGAATNGNSLHAPSHHPAADVDDEDDDDYWASYDRTPGRTPARTPAKRSPAPRLGPASSELEYFARYAEEVQLAMDPHDPAEEVPEQGASTLNGNAISFGNESKPAVTPHTEPSRKEPSVNGNGINGTVEASQPTLPVVHAPRPISPPTTSSRSSSSSGSVARLEHRARTHSQAELGIKKHISTDIKSLFRLAMAAGIERAEFERIVKTELDLLSMMEMDE